MGNFANPPGGGGGGGSVLGLGPAQNTFGDATTANRAAAETLRDTYATANATWLAQYNDDLGLWIRLVWNGGVAEQRRNSAGNGWEDVTNVIRGQAGSMGRDGTPGGGAWNSLGSHSESDPHASNDFFGTGITIPDGRPVIGYRLAGNQNSLEQNAGIMMISANLLFSKAAADDGDTSTDDNSVHLPEFSSGGVVTGTVHAGYTSSRELLIATTTANQTTSIEVFEYVPATAQGGRTDAEIQALINATNLSALQGQVMDGQIPASIFRDAELTAAAVRTQLGLTATEAEELLTGNPTIAGNVITFTRNDGTTGTITIPAGGDGELLFGAVDPVAADGIDGDAWLNTTAGTLWKKASGAWAQQYTIGSGMSGMHASLYFGTSADDTPTGAELTIAGSMGTGTIPAYAGSMHLLIARLATEGDITSVIFSDDATMTNMVGAFTKFGSTIMPTGETDAYNVWVSNQLLTQAADVTLTVS